LHLSTTLFYENQNMATLAPVPSSPFTGGHEKSYKKSQYSFEVGDSDEQEVNLMDIIEEINSPIDIGNRGRYQGGMADLAHFLEHLRIEDAGLRGIVEAELLADDPCELTFFPSYATPDNRYDMKKRPNTDSLPQLNTKRQGLQRELNSSDEHISMVKKMKSERRKRTKFSSTSTLFVSDTISQPDCEEITKCAGELLLTHIEKGCKIDDKIYYTVFNEEVFPLTNGVYDTREIPTAESVNKFLQTIVSYQKLDMECVIMSLVYVQRLLEITKITIDSTNWRRIILAALIVASKIWEDFAVWNQDFLSIFDNVVPVRDLNQVELQFLNLVQYNLAINASTFAKYYFELRTLSKKEDLLPTKPLNKESAERLENRSQVDKRQWLKRTSSADQLDPFKMNSPAIIN